LGRQLHVPDTPSGGFHLYFDVVTEPAEAVHELAFRHVREVATKQAGHLGLRQSHAPTGFFLRQAETTHSFDNLNHQARFDFQFFHVSQTKIGKDIARTQLKFEVLNDSLGYGHVFSHLCGAAMRRDRDLASRDAFDLRAQSLLGMPEIVSCLHA